jgi:STE24 endopeptidase
LEFNYISVLFVAVYLFQMVFSLWLDQLNRRHLAEAGKEIPATFEGFIDKDSLSKINTYTIDRSRLFQTRKIISDILLLAFILSGFFLVLNDCGMHVVSGYVWPGVIFFLLFGSIFFILDLPFDFYETFVIEEKYGFNKSDTKTWIIDNVKSGIISIVLLVAILAPLLWIIQAFPNYWWFWGFAIVAVVQLVLVILYPIVIAPMFNKFERLKDQVLADEVNALAKNLGMKTSGIFQMDAGRRSTHSNAYFTGLGKTKRVVLFDTLIQSHGHDEILSILAHEIGHYKLKHIMKSYIIAQLSMLAGFYLTFLILNWNSFYETFGFETSQSYIGLLIISIFGKRISFFLKPLYMSLSRKFEKQADEFAMNARPDPTPFILSLKKLSVDNLSNLNPHPLYVWFSYSHPPVLERINYLERKTKNMEKSNAGKF